MHSRTLLIRSSLSNPNPDYAFFARWMLRGRAEVHQLALSDVSGRGTLYVPISDRGLASLHLAGQPKANALPV